MKVTLVTAIALFASGVALADNDILKPFPNAESGFKRHVISVEPKNNEADFKVEVIAGKTLTVDCNSQHLGGDLKSHDLQGWGYNYYEVPEPKGPASTLMACLEDTKRNAFVPMRGEGYVLRYNSKMPIVIYAPASIEVNYRIWSASEQTHPAPIR